jgi:hypothetical protein
VILNIEHLRVQRPSLRTGINAERTFHKLSCPRSGPAKRIFICTRVSVSVCPALRSRPRALAFALSGLWGPELIPPVIRQRPREPRRRDDEWLGWGLLPTAGCWTQLFFLASCDCMQSGGVCGVTTKRMSSGGWPRGMACNSKFLACNRRHKSLGRRAATDRDARFQEPGIFRLIPDVNINIAGWLFETIDDDDLPVLE